MRRLAAGLVFALALAASVAPRVGADSDPSTIARRLHAEGNYTDHLDRGSRPPPPDDLGNRSSGRRGHRRGRGPRLGAPPGLFAVTSAVSWVIIGIAALALGAALAYLLVSIGRNLRLPSREPRAARPKAIPAVEERASSMPPPPPDFDLLAAGGNFDGAIAAVLHAALVAVGWRPFQRERALTAREVLRGLGNAITASALREIVAIAEAVRFAGTPATADDFLRAKQALFRIVPPAAHTP